MVRRFRKLLQKVQRFRSDVAAEHRMRSLRFWIPSIIGLAITPIAILAALFSTGAGHGNYGAAIVLYPLSMIVLVLSAGFRSQDAFAAELVQSLSLVLVFTVGILQFPVYGFVLSYARLKKSWWPMLGSGIIYLHLFVIAVWIVISGFMWATAA